MGAAANARERIAAKRALADVRLSDLVEQPLLDPDDDDVSRLLLEGHDRQRFAEIASLTVGEFRELLLDDATTDAVLHGLRWAILPEMAAAVAKLMSNKDLVLVAARIRNITRARNTMGQAGQDFEKGAADGTADALAVLEAITARFPPVQP